MSDAAQSATESRTATPPAEASPTPGGPTPAGGLRPLLFAAAGGLVVGAMLFGAMSMVQRAMPETAALQIIAARDLDDAALSLDSSMARRATEDAKQCKIPLAFVTLSAAPGQALGSVRIRSGSYLSPATAISNAPRRVAVPFPAPYETGKGMLSIEGTAHGLNVWLSPGRYFEMLNGTEQIPVVWTPKTPPC